MLCLHNPGASVEKQRVKPDFLQYKGRRSDSDPKRIKRMQDTLKIQNIKEGRSLEYGKRIE